MTWNDLIPWNWGRKASLRPPEEGDEEGWPRGFVPRVDVQEKDDVMTVTAELPGVEEKDLDISVDHGSLVIRGEKRSEHREESEGRTMVERTYGSFQRTIPLPGNVDPEKVEATF